VEGELAREGRLDHFAPQALANSLWAFATLRYFPAQPCFQALIRHISDNIPYFKEQVDSCAVDMDCIRAGHRFDGYLCTCTERMLLWFKAVGRRQHALLALLHSLQ
jgi:hypothetical protein